MFFFINEESDENDKQSIIDLFQMSGDNHISRSNDAGLIKSLEETSKEKSETKEEMPESIDCSSLIPNDMGDNKLEARRQKGRVRSKKSRDRKKQYLDELEVRVKDLEKENIKLRQEIDLYKVLHNDYINHYISKFWFILTLVNLKLIFFISLKIVLTFFNF